MPRQGVRSYWMASLKKRVKKTKILICLLRKLTGLVRETEFSAGENFAKVKGSLMIVMSYKSCRDSIERR